MHYTHFSFYKDFPYVLCEQQIKFELAHALDSR